jgi:hypothetical protein
VKRTAAWTVLIGVAGMLALARGEEQTTNQVPARADSNGSAPGDMPRSMLKVPVHEVERAPSPSSWP